MNVLAECCYCKTILTRWMIGGELTEPICDRCWRQRQHPLIVQVLDELVEKFDSSTDFHRGMYDYYSE